MADKTLDQKQIDELMNNLEDVNFEEIELPTRKCKDIKTYRIPFLSEIRKIKTFKKDDKHLIVIQFENNKFFVEYFDKKIFHEDVFMFKMKAFMFLSIPYEDSLELLKTHTGTSWKIEEEERIQIKIKY